MNDLPDKDYDNPELNIFLNDKEKKNLKYLEDKSRLSKNIEIKQSDFMNKSLKEILEEWSKNNIEIFSDIVEFMSNISKYTDFFGDLDDTSNIALGIKNIFYDFSLIFIKNERSIYFGITLIMISMILYFIGISS